MASLQWRQWSLCSVGRSFIVFDHRREGGGAAQEAEDCCMGCVAESRHCAKQAKDGKLKEDNSDVYSDPEWSRELGPSSEISDKRVFWEEFGHDYALFVKELGVLRSRADGARSREEAFDGHMAIGRVLYEYQLYKEALKEMTESDTPVSYSGSGAPEKSIRKASLEAILHRLLNFLRPETFVGAVKAINQKILSVLDETETCRVDLGMFFAVLAPICSGSPKKRKRVAFDALLWRPVNEDSTQIKKSEALRYIKLLRAIRLMRVGFSTSLQTQASFT
ncbi:hypothetical protein ACSBR1_028785 [Camellia fascicularis]